MKLATMIFQHFSAIYVHKWTDQFSDAQMLKAVLREWTIGLRGLTQEQVMKGVDICRVYEAWPPSIADFIKHATDSKSIPLQSKAYQPWIALPGPKGDPDLAQDAIRQIKQCLQ